MSEKKNGLASLFLIMLVALLLAPVLLSSPSCCAMAAEGQSEIDEIDKDDRSIVTMYFTDISFKQLVRLVARQAKINAITDKALNNKVAIEAHDENALEVLKRAASENNLKYCQIGKITYFYDYTSFRITYGPNDVQDTVEEAARTYLDRLAPGADKLVSLSGYDLELEQLLEEIAQSAGFMYTSKIPYRMRTEIEFTNVPASDAFVALAMSNGLGVEFENNTWVIIRPEKYFTLAE